MPPQIWQKSNEAGHKEVFSRPKEKHRVDIPMSPNFLPEKTFFLILKEGMNIFHEKKG